MATQPPTSSTLTRVREAQEAVDKAGAAMDSVQTGLSAVESVAERAESARRHPVGTGAILFLVVSIALGAIMGVKSVSNS